MAIRTSAEYRDRIAIRRPGWIPGLRIRHQQTRSAPIRADCIDPSRRRIVHVAPVAIRGVREYDQFSVGRPAWIDHGRRRPRQLPFLTAVDLAAPQRSFGIRNVGHPLTIAGEIDVAGGNSSKVGDELAGVAIVNRQFSLMRLAHREKLSAVFTQDRRAERARSEGQLLRSWGVALRP